ncbi:hypothetical protein AGMMS49574_17400 [Bacteroidia bacterium]|nr:hypothetical protein AGMMS49574_17400 [Bacteroidia bacterium]
MRNFNLRVIGIVLALMAGTSYLGATDIYVHTGANGTGTNVTPFDIGGLRSYLTSYTVASGTELNVYFTTGAYNVTSVLTFNSTVANVNGLNVRFAPNPSNIGNVTFSNGSSNNIRFAATTGNAANPMSLNIANVTISDFSTTTAATDNGSTSLFTLSVGATIELENVTLNNITSTGYTLVTNSGSAGATFSVSGSTLTNITSTSAYLFRTSAANENVIFDGCTLSNWTSAGGAMFYLSSYADCSLTFSNNTEVSTFAVNAGHIFHLNVATNSLTITGNTFTANRAGPSTSGNNDFNFVYVSNAATGNGSLDITNNTFTDNHTNGVFIQTARSGPITGNTFSLNTTEHNTAATNRPFIQATAAVEIENNIFTTNTAHGNFITASGATSLVGNMFVNNQSAGGNSTGNNTFVALSGAADVSFNTFESNGPSATTLGHLINLTGAGTKLYNNTFKTNAPTNGGYVILAGAGSSASPLLIYNNTLSGNTSGYAINIGSNYVKLFNNTIYASGRVITGAQYGDLRIYNNIVGPGPNDIIDVTGANETGRTVRNIIGTSYYAAGVSNGTNIAGPLAAQLQTTLSGPPEWGREVYDLVQAQIYAPSHAILKLGGSLSALATSLSVSTLPTLLATDQLGTTRNPAAISLGSVDRYGLFVTQPGSIKVTYDVDDPIPHAMNYDLRDLILKYPEGVDPNNVRFDFVGGTPTLTNGTVSLSGSILHFAPFVDSDGYAGGHPISSVQIRVHEDIVSNQQSITPVNIYVLEVPRPPGLLNVFDYPNTCFDLMGTVDFTSAFRFVTSLYNNPPIFAGIPPGRKNPSENRIYGFSIPLIGDLDKDGYPEIFAIGRDDNGTGLQSNIYRYLYIYSGQTGTQLAKLRLDLGTTGTPAAAGHPSGYHSTPSIMALVDADRDSIPEVIMAFPASTYGTFPYANKVVSYKLTKIVPTPSTGNQYTMSLNWQSAANYNLGGSSGNSAQTSYQRPIPQIVDIEGNGDAKVVVYNKIYDAETGKLEVTLGKLGADAYVGTATNAAVTQDGYINFSYIYDLDLDGKYDIVAGGKVYYNIDIANGTYQTVDFSSQVKDGRTGVADINGDGIPDVVVVNRVNSGSRLEIFVWNPDFLRINAGGEIERNAGVKSPSMLATLTMPFNNNGTGTNSYVYIGDIDGKEQVIPVAGGGTKTYRLPEIAILSGTMTYNNGTGTYPVHIHPNVSSIIPTMGGIPTSGTSPASGVLAAVTWDARPSIPINQRLKLSFVLGHQDGSINTGFTMFDFDNDGMMEICYRDMQYLRIIKASRPYIAYNAALDDPAVLFRTRARSNTGFEYPVIADIDNDASAEMVVIATDQDANLTYGYVYAVGNGGGDKFAPARPVWNQFMYDPFKINDILQTPVGPALNRLGKEFQYDLKIRNSAGVVTQIKKSFNPFNATLNQITYHEADTVGATDRPYFEPIVFLTEAYIVGHDDPSSARRPQIVTEASNNYLEFTLGNRATAMTALSLNIPIAVYRNNTISQATHVGTTSLGLLTYQNNLPITQVVRPGQEIRVRIRIVAPDTELGVYWIRAGDDSKLNSSNVWEWHFGYNSTNEVVSGTGYGLSSKAFRDCNWSDQSVRISQYRPFDDAVTVQQYNQAEIFMFLNDILPDLPGNNYYSGVVLGTNFSFTQPEAGTVSFNSSGQTSKFTYLNNGNTLENNVDSFTYTVHFQDPATLAYIDRSAKVYIYVMESASGNFASCFGITTVIDLVNKPTGVSFDWYRENVGGSRFGVGRNYTMTSQQMADSIYYLKPNMPVGRYHDIDFPRGRLAILLITPELNAVATLRWTGLVDNNWANPNNWVEIITDGGKKYEKPAGFAPSSCVDIIIPTGAVNYPEVRIKPSHARHITMQDRAMLKNPQNLVYESASAEFKLKPAERDRYIMWSAPLKSVYSGDYHVKHAVTNQPVWGDVFVNFFQQSNPDNGSLATGAVNMFTASFGHLGTPLGLGRPFNLKVVTTTSSKDKTFLFPQTAPSYTDNQTVPVMYPTTRSMGNRFITDDLSLNPNMDVFGGEFNGSLVQVVNPYFAYLNVSDFLANNPALSAGTYLIWNGEIHSSFDAVKVHPAPNGLRYTSTAPANVNVGWIPPLQSFFVQKVTPSAILTKVQMSADWTSVRNTDITNPYVLRATQEPEKGVLHIKATQGNNTSYTLLSYNKDASPNFNSKEDVLSLFFNEIGLTLYSVTQLKEPLAINTSGNFVSQPTYLGLRARDAGEIKLTFTGLPTFEHEVSLRDKQLNKLVPLKEGDTYTFAVSKPSGAGAAFDILDRISLEMKYTGSVGTESISAEVLDVHVSSEYGRILVKSNKGLISNLQIYSIPGTLVYSSNTLSDQFSIPVSGAQTYIVKIQFANNENRVEKVFVK